MITTRTTPIVSPVLIGRAHQLAALERLIDEARLSRGQVALIAGEAGIGKTRLILETKARATDQGFSVLQGHCFAPDRVLPFAPLIDLLQTWCANRAADEIVRTFGATTTALVRLLPELRSLLPDAMPTIPDAPEQEKRRLFQALMQ